MGTATMAVLARVPGWVLRWAAGQSVRAVTAARRQGEVRCLAELSHCLDAVDEGYVFHPPFLVVKGKSAGRTRLFAAKLAPGEVADFRSGRALPPGVGDFVWSLKPGWRRVLASLTSGRRRVTAQELPPVSVGGRG